MNDPVQIAPLLSVFSDDGEFTLRVDGSELSKLLTPQITAAIGQTSKARKLTLLTPTDTKIFKFNGNQAPLPGPAIPSTDRVTITTPPKPSIVQDFSAPPSPEIAAEAVDEFDRTIAEQQKAEQEMRQAERFAKADPGLEQEEVPAPRKRAKERPTPLSSTTCGRCSGAGVLDGGGTCPVCQGQRAIPHYGRRSR